MKDKNIIKTIFSFDVELYFGSFPGTIERNIIEPTEALLQLGRKYGICFTFFIDAGYLAYLEQNRLKNTFLDKEYCSFTRLIRKLDIEGHDVQLHIHPSWEDANWNGQWHFNSSRYSVDKFSLKCYEEIFSKYKIALDSLLKKPTSAFRAGGFCIQGLQSWAEIFSRHGIHIDSSLYYGGKEKSKTHSYNFTSISRDSTWRFSTNPINVDPSGVFIEVPVSSIFLAPKDFFHVLYARKFGNFEDKAMGDGKSTSFGIKRKLIYALKGSYAADSVDSGKCSYLPRYLNDIEKRKKELLHVMGHPKAISKRSLLLMEDYIIQNKHDNIVVLSDYA